VTNNTQRITEECFDVCSSSTDSESVEQVDTTAADENGPVEPKKSVTSR